MDSDVILPSGDIVTKEGGRIEVRLKKTVQPEVEEVSLDRVDDTGPKSTKVVYDGEAPKSTLMEALLKDTTQGIRAYEGRDRDWKEKLNDVELVVNPEIEVLREKAKSKLWWDTMQKIGMLSRLTNKLRPVCRDLRKYCSCLPK